MHTQFIGLIGAGYWGKNLLRNLADIGVLHTVCEANPDLLRQREKEYPGSRYVRSFEALLASPEITAVAVATPASTHYEIVKLCLQADKDVFVEKPLALRVSEAEELRGLAARRGKVLMVGHILLYHPAVLKLNEIIRQGLLGRIEYIYSHRLNMGKLRVEENILWSFAPHDISTILWLVNEEPREVKSFGGSYLTQGVYDTTLTLMEFKHNVKTHIFVSWLHPFKEQKLIVVGNKGMAVFNDQEKTEKKLIVYPHKVEWRSGKIPVAQKAEHYCVDIEDREPLREELLHFIECAQSRVDPRSNAEEAIRVLSVLDRAQKSLEQRSAAPVSSPTGEFFAHPSAVLDEGCEIGPGTKIWYFSHVLPRSRIGADCVLGQNVTVGPDAVIGDRCKIQNNVSVYKAVQLEDEVFVGPSAVFTNVINPRAFIERKEEFKKTLVKQGATIGANATVVCGVTIGRYAFIAAGATVTKDVPDFALMKGIPARQQGWVCRCAFRLGEIRDEARCPDCGAQYRLRDGRIQPRVVPTESRAVR
ncbi:MAG: oxidoreductase [Candidatus Omnitrophica bacterium]|nr:oxidoreductase [Candidatus Omnitrophota bacterium]